MENPTIAVIGGTGPQGRALGLRLAAAGHDVVLGSREAARAGAAAEELASGRELRGSVTGAANHDAAAKADIVLLAVPYKGHGELVAQLADVTSGKIVISCVNPLGFDRSGPYGLSLESGSAAEEAAALLPDAVVVGAFHHLSAVTLLEGGELDEDVLVCSDRTDAAEVVADLARSVTGRRGIHAGPLRLARQLEPLTAVLISVNRLHRAHSGVRLTGLDRTA
ncbi:MAG TPA: NADPH-dependent F420 reductase [Marmoricola sp.]|nr:NADPH-dependent F420 reductase [Marmoricola sp.]